jgi:hypothetical protein
LDLAVQGVERIDHNFVAGVHSQGCGYRGMPPVMGLTRLHREPLRLVQPKLMNSAAHNPSESMRDPMPTLTPAPVNCKVSGALARIACDGLNLEVQLVLQKV